MFPFSSISAYKSAVYDLVQTMLLELEAEAEEPVNHNASCQALSLFILWLLLVKPCFSFH